MNLVSYLVVSWSGRLLPDPGLGVRVPEDGPGPLLGLPPLQKVKDHPRTLAPQSSQIRTIIM